VIYVMSRSLSQKNALAKGIPLPAFQKALELARGAFVGSDVAAVYTGLLIGSTKASDSTWSTAALWEY
jgi:hypothetical protein